MSSCQMNSQVTLAGERHRPSSLTPRRLILREDEKKLKLPDLTHSHALSSLGWFTKKGTPWHLPIGKPPGVSQRQRGFLGGCEWGRAVERALGRWTGEKGQGTASPTLPCLGLSVPLCGIRAGHWTSLSPKARSAGHQSHECSGRER